MGGGVTSRRYVRQGGAWVPRDPSLPALGTTPPPDGMLAKASGIWGAGFQNAGDIRSDGALMLSGGDVGGIHLSKDAGDTWEPNNAGLSESPHLRVASLRWSANPATPNRAWYHSVGTPSDNNNNYLWVGDYDPVVGAIVRWNQHTALPTVWCRAGNGAESGDSLASSNSGHPRQTGRQLMALDETANYIYLGSRDGLWRITVDKSAAPVRLWGAGLAVTCVELDPLTPGTAYVTVDLGPVGNLTSGVGLYKLSGLRGTVTQAGYLTVGDGMVYPQQVAARVKDGITRLFVATGKRCTSADPTGGIKYHPGGTFTAGWTDLTGTLNASETSYNQWTAVDAALRGNGTWRLAVAHCADPSSGAAGKLAWCDWSGTGTPTWAQSMSPTQVSYEVNAPAGPIWFLSQSSTHSFLMADKRGADARPVIDPNNPDNILYFGRSGIWRLKPSISTKLHPVVRGLAVTTSKQGRFDRTDAQRLIVADVDWTMLRLSNGGVTEQPWAHNLPSTLGSVAKIEGSAITAHTDGRMSFGGGDSAGNTNGALFVGLPFASSAGDWVDELGTGSGRPWTSWTDTPWCLGQTFTGTGAGQIVLAALNSTGAQTNAAKTGLWRKVGSGAGGTWTKITVAGLNMDSNGVHVEFAWVSPTVVWMVESKTGLWQSRDAGLTWTNRYSASWTTRYTGHLRVDDTRANTVWAVTKGSECWKITAADTASPVRTAAVPPACTAPAAVAVDATTGFVYVAEQGTPHLWESRDNGGTWSDLASPSYQSMAFTVKDLDVHDGRAVVAMFAGYSIMELPS